MTPDWHSEQSFHTVSVFGGTIAVVIGRVNGVEVNRYLGRLY